MKIIENIKYQIADWIDNRYPESCWANLVMWSMGYCSTKEMFNRDDGVWNNQICRKSNKSTPWAYCGKCEKNGRITGN